MSVLLLVGYIAAVLGGLWLLVLIFQNSVVWGICSLVIPFVSLIFVFTNWDDAKKPFLMQVVGLVLIFLGADAAVDASGLE